MTVVPGHVLVLQAHIKVCALMSLIGIHNSYMRLAQFYTWFTSITLGVSKYNGHFV